MHLNVPVFRPFIARNFLIVAKFRFQLAAKRVSSNFNIIGNLNLAFNWHLFWILMSVWNIKFIGVNQFVLPVGCVIIMPAKTETK